MRHISPSYRVFTVFNTLLLSVLAVLCIAPIIHILALSFSSAEAITANLVTFWPVDFTLEAYRSTLGSDLFLGSMRTSVLRTLFGTSLHLFLICTAGYALSKENAVFRSRSWYAWFFVFTMLFNAGLIPNYLVVKNLGLLNTLFALILPNALGVWSLILLMNFFRAIPKELEEASLIDGATHFTTLLRIYLPISLPALATMALFNMVHHWNSWFDGLIYMTDVNNYPLASYLQTVVVDADYSAMTGGKDDLSQVIERNLKASQIFVGTLPILLVYPFLQKYFVKGIVLGAVKE